MSIEEIRDLKRSLALARSAGNREVVSDQILVQWKRNRGMYSSAAMDSKGKRSAWLKDARLAIVGL